MPRENLRFLFFCAALLRAVDSSPADISLDTELEDMLGALARGEDTRDVRAHRQGLRGPRPARPTTSSPRRSTRSATRSNAWTEAGERYDVAVREVVADSYRRHRAATMLQLA